MADDLKSNIVNFLIVGLFMVAMFTFAIGIAEKNKPIDGFNTTGVDISGMESNLENAQDQAESWQTVFEEKNPIIALGELVVGSIWGVTKLIGTSIKLVANIIFGAAGKILGIPPMVIGVVSAILIISIILSVWSILKTGK